MVRAIGPQALLRLRIELEHSSPLIWRTVLVPDNITLVKLHLVIQEAMGWWSSHLHEFVIDHRHYGVITDWDLDWDTGPELINEQRKRLEKVLGRKKQFEYLYDFGDAWWHQITVEALQPLATMKPSARCIGGEMACPPEDVGGLGGYFDFLEAMSDPNHEEHENMLRWHGHSFDPRTFDVVQVNENLKQIKL